MVYKRYIKNRKGELIKIAKFMKNYNFNKIIEKIYKDIDKLSFMRRMHKTLISFNDLNGEYRRMVSGKYSVIYKIVENEIIILRVFNQKENYLNQTKFILREKSTKYYLIKYKEKSII